MSEKNPLSPEGHNGILVQGTLEGSSDECLLVIHQSQLQVLLSIRKVEDEKQRFRIGFNVPDAKGEA